MFTFSWIESEKKLIELIDFLAYLDHQRGGSHQNQEREVGQGQDLEKNRPVLNISMMHISTGKKG